MTPTKNTATDEPVLPPPAWRGVVKTADTLTISLAPSRTALVFVCEHQPEGEERECFQCRAIGRLDGKADHYLELFELLQDERARGGEVSDELVGYVAQRANDYVDRAKHPPRKLVESTGRAARAAVDTRIAKRKGRAGTAPAKRKRRA